MWARKRGYYDLLICELKMRLVYCRIINYQAILMVENQVNKYLEIRNSIQEGKWIIID